MAIQQTKKQSDLEKRLQLLRRQVYGKNPDRSDETRKSENQKISEPESLTHRYTGIPISSDPPAYQSTDLVYLHQDLFKILIFASCAIGGQVILFLLVKNNVFTLSFF